jgi:hypothetical protein
VTVIAGIEAVAVIEIDGDWVVERRPVVYFVR